MSSGVDTRYRDLVQMVESGRTLQHYVNKLGGGITFNSIPGKDCWSQVECASNESDLLESIRVEFGAEIVQSKKITSIVEAIISPPIKSLHLSRGIKLSVFQNGLSNLRHLVGEDDCIVLIPVAIEGPAEVTVQETTGDRRIGFTLAKNSEVIIKGSCSIQVPPETKAVCVVLCIAKDKG